MSHFDAYRESVAIALGKRRPSFPSDLAKRASLNQLFLSAPPAPPFRAQKLAETEHRAHLNASNVPL